MSFADPQTVTVDSTPYTLNRVESSGQRSVYSTDDEEYKLTLSHQVSGKKTRRLARLDQRVVAADPLTSVNEYKTLGVYLVIEEPEYGFADADIYKVIAGFQAWLTEAQSLKLLSNQH